MLELCNKWSFRYGSIIFEVFIYLNSPKYMKLFIINVSHWIWFNSEHYIKIKLEWNAQNMSFFFSITTLINCKLDLDHYPHNDCSNTEKRSSHNKITNHFAIAKFFSNKPLRRVKIKKASFFHSFHSRWTCVDCVLNDNISTESSKAEEKSRNKQMKRKKQQYRICRKICKCI